MNELDHNIGIDKPSKTYQKKVGCGSLYVIFNEHYNGNFDHLIIRGSMSKRTDCGDSWIFGIAKLLTYALRRAFKEDDDSRERGIVRQLIAHTCSKCSLKTELSCISAIGRAIDDYLKLKK